MKPFTITTKSLKRLADTITPVSIYLKIRDIYPNSILLESSDYRGNENSFSYICLEPLATFEADNGSITETYPDGSKSITAITGRDIFNVRFAFFTRSFILADPDEDIPVNGLFGYMCYDTVQYFEKIRFSPCDSFEHSIPDVKYSFYRYIIAIDHFRNVMQITENCIDGEPEGINDLATLLNNRNYAFYPFAAVGEKMYNMSDDEYIRLVTKGKEHCFRGDVFQIVLSRQFARKFSGDEFNVYRALRSVNPSPWLFYFDYGSYKIFGSSPEAQIKIRDRKAYINPIAGTFRRSGDDETDKMNSERLSYDMKENAEHIMLVDLARNDLSRHAVNVKVESLREIQFYSHVIHLVSSVSGDLREGSDIHDILTATFPAGTLTGAPKHMAMQLIDRYESLRRGYYGGAIGFIDLRGNVNHAIMIRTFLSKDNILYYRAGAGIVAGSNENNELNEVSHKLGALEKAIEIAGGIK